MISPTVYLVLIASIILVDTADDNDWPLQPFVDELNGECLQQGSGKAVANGFYVKHFLGLTDVNGDRVPDYFAYRCMFECEKEPTAFIGLGLPCASGVLMLSTSSGYKTVHLPGAINRAYPGLPLRVVLTRRRGPGDTCPSLVGCEYVYVLKDGRFQEIGQCPQAGCKDNYLENEIFDVAAHRHHR